jgi:predicted DNA-binding protein
MPGRLESTGKGLPQKVKEELQKDEEPDAYGIEDIIKEKPKPKIVREFIEAQINSIEDENEKLFSLKAGINK